MNQLNEEAQRILNHAAACTQHTLQAFRDQVAKEDSSPSYLINAFAKQQFKAEFMLRHIKGIRYASGPEGRGVEDLLNYLQGDIDRWTPTNSTCLIARLQGDIELDALRSAKKLVTSIMKANVDEDEPNEYADSHGRVVDL